MTYTINLTKDELDMLQFVYNEYINRDDLFQMDLEPNKEQIFHDVDDLILDSIADQVIRNDFSSVMHLRGTRADDFA